MIFMTRKTAIISLITSVLYILIAIYMMNGELVRDTLLGSFSLQYKFELMIALLQGMWTAMSGAGIFILVTIALLTGINLALLFQRFSILRKSGNIHFIAGGGSIFGIVSSGCVTCGLPVLALLGLSGSVVYLPLKGVELSFISILLLVGSLTWIVQTNKSTKICKLELRKV